MIPKLDLFKLRIQFKSRWTQINGDWELLSNSFGLVRIKCWFGIKISDWFSVDLRQMRSNIFFGLTRISLDSDFVMKKLVRNEFQSETFIRVFNPCVQSNFKSNESELYSDETFNLFQLLHEHVGWGMRRTAKTAKRIALSCAWSFSGSGNRKRTKHFSKLILVLFRFCNRKRIERPRP